MTYRIPPLKGLHAFEAAARHLSFKTAANELGVTAGAVSQQVRKLETSLGVALFRRLPHGLLLTVEGERYYPRIAKAFEDLTAATEAVAPDLNAKKFKLGLCPDAAALLPARWPRHSAALKNFVSETRATDDLELLHVNQLDCVVRAGSGPTGGLAAVSLAANGSDASGRLQLVCRKGLVDCRQSKAILEDLRRCLR